jgi:RNA polymerase sigma-70 factor (ECF subfamily)
MGTIMTNDTRPTPELLHQAAAGDQQAWSILLGREQPRLRRMVALRLDRRLQGRIDPEDVLQEAYLEAATHLRDFLGRSEPSFFLWLRGIVGNKLLALHRQHLGTHMRDAGREVSLYHGTMPETSSAALAAHLLGHDPRPSEAAMQAERKVRLQEALNRMDPLDREVLALRHFEQLTTAETAQLLGIQSTAAGKRYIRALKRLREVLLDMPGGLGEVWP